VKGKVVVTFLTACIAVLLAWVVMHTVFSETLKTVDKLSLPNERQLLINRIFRSISKINQLQYVEYSTIGEPRSKDKFITATERLKARLDSLSMFDPHNHLQQQRIDSMKYLITAHQAVYLNYVKLKADIIQNRSFSRKIKQLANMVSESSAKKDTNVITSQKKVVTVIEPEEEKKAKPEKTQLGTFIDKLFGRKTKQDVHLKKTITEEYNVKVDTLSLSQQDSMLNLISGYMGKMTKDQQRKSIRFIEKEKDLMKSGNLIVNRMFSLITSIKEEETQSSAVESSQAANTISNGLFRLNIIIVLFFGMAGLLLLLIFFDISRSNQYRIALQESRDEAERLAQVKQRFLANMSHEIRTPLQSILGFSEQAYKQQSADASTLDAIYQSSSHLLHIVNEVLDYSRITSGKFTIQEQPFRICALIREVSGVLDVHARAKSLEFKAEHSLDEETTYIGDAFRLKQLLYNLLGNAIKFTARGSVELKIEEIRTNKDALLRFTIRDTGIGMSREQLDVMFNEFEQTGEQITTSYGGTGLGLSIVKELVTAMDGSIAASSEKGSGTAFTLELKYSVTEAGEIPGHAAQVSEINREVWMADDDSYILKVCEVIFSTHHISYRLFSSAYKLLNEITGANDPVYLLDIRMPDMDGFELCRRIREFNPHATIIALTAQALPEEHEAILNNGFDAILTKPFVEAGLLQMLAKHNHPEGAEVKFDLTRMGQFAGGNRETLLEHLGVFTDESSRDIRDLKVNLDVNNREQVYELLHRLAGRIALAGASELAAELRDLEHGVKDEVLTIEMKKEILVLCNKADQLLAQLSDLR
jgi:signal transduction histidine kinase/CheY-like chemotaxis protein/HPt (histidine-containing phosphotransfer) domain-containing protein